MWTIISDILYYIDLKCQEYIVIAANFPSTANMRLRVVLPLAGDLHHLQDGSNRSLRLVQFNIVIALLCKKLLAVG